MPKGNFRSIDDEIEFVRKKVSKKVTENNLEVEFSDEIAEDILSIIARVRDEMREK